LSLSEFVSVPTCLSCFGVWVLHCNSLVSSVLPEDQKDRISMRKMLSDIVEIVPVGLAGDLAPI